MEKHYNLLHNRLAGMLTRPFNSEYSMIGFAVRRAERDAPEKNAVEARKERHREAELEAGREDYSTPI